MAYTFLTVRLTNRAEIFFFKRSVIMIRWFWVEKPSLNE